MHSQKYSKTFPSQKKTTSQKTDEWFKQCIDAAESIILFQNEGIRQSRINKKVNYNLYNDILDTRDIEKVCNPMGLSMDSFPAKPRMYSIALPKINTLAGEELKRRFDFKIVVTNPDAISEKEKEQSQLIKEALESVMIDDQMSEEEVTQKLRSTEKYLNMTHQDKRELGATWILNHYYGELDLKTTFNRGMYDALIAGEEIYCIDEEAGEPVVRKCNPLNTYAVLEPDNPYWDNAEIIIEEGYYSVGTVIDTYFDELSSDDIEYLEKGTNTSEMMSPRLSIDSNISSIGVDGHPLNSDLIDIDAAQSPSIGGDFDDNGNVRILRVTWKGRRKLGELTYFGEQGEKLTKWVDEYYPVDESMGETVDWVWVNEYHQGDRIGKDLYKKMRIKPVQFRNMTNPSKCSSGYVGTQFNVNSSKTLSLMDRMKPYIYLYIIYMYRTELAFAKAKGKIAELDISKVPDGWEVEKWMHFAEVHGWAVVDPFNEGKKGKATGKLAGDYNTTGKVLDMQLGDYIQQHIAMLEYVERQLAKISGVTEQREGAISGGDGLGVTQQAIIQSSNITEAWFAAHDNVKLRVLKMLLETAKYCLKDKGKIKAQYIMDDMISTMYELDTEDFCETEYGLNVANSSSDAELLEALKGLAHAGIQNDKISFSQLMDIYNTASLSTIRRKIEAAEQESQQRAQEASKAEQQHQEALQSMMLEEKKLDRDLQQYKIDTEAATRISVAQINAYKMQEDWDKDNDGEPDPLQIADQAFKQQDAAAKQLEAQKQAILKEKEINNKKEIEKDKIELERNKIEAAKELQKDKDKAAMEREKLKAKTSLKNPVAGERNKKK